MSDLSWAERWEGALCTQIGDPDLWTPEKGGVRNEVKATCRRCPFGPGGDNACLEFALDKGYTDNDTGIWGATVPRERRRMLQARTAA